MSRDATGYNRHGRIKALLNVADCGFCCNLRLLVLKLVRGVGRFGFVMSPLLCVQRPLKGLFMVCLRSLFGALFSANFKVLLSDCENVRIETPNKL